MRWGTWLLKPKLFSKLGLSTAGFIAFSGMAETFDHLIES